MKKIIGLMLTLSSVAMGSEVPEALRGGVIVVKTKDGKTTEFSADKWKVVPRAGCTTKKSSGSSKVYSACPVCPTCPTVIQQSTSYPYTKQEPIAAKAPEPDKNRLSVLAGIPTNVFNRDVEYEMSGDYQAAVTPISLVYSRDVFDSFHLSAGHVWSYPNFVVLGGGLNW
jgi:hypothetical protein